MEEEAMEMSFGGENSGLWSAVRCVWWKEERKWRGRRWRWDGKWRNVSNEVGDEFMKLDISLFWAKGMCLAEMNMNGKWNEGEMQVKWNVNEEMGVYGWVCC